MHTTYRAYRFFRFQVLATFAILGVVAVVLIVDLAAGGDVPLLFASFWLAALGWNAYWFGFRLAYELELSGDALRWRAPLAGGAVRVADIVAVRPMRLAPSVQVIERREGRPVLVWATRRLILLLDELAAAAPGVGVRVGWSVRTAARTSERVDRLGTGSKRALLGGLIVAFVLSVVALVFGTVHSANQSQEILERSVPVQGEIVRFTGNRRASRDAIVRYQVEGQPREDPTIIYDLDAQVGDPVALRYDPEQPRRVFDASDREPPGGELPIWVPFSFMSGAASAVLAVRLGLRWYREGA